MSQIDNHPYIQTNIGSEIEKGYWASSLFNFYTGSREDRVIRQVLVDSIMNYTFRLKGKSDDLGVIGNADLVDNLGSIDYYAQNMTVETVGMAYKSEIKQYSKAKNINFEKESKENLTQWFRERSDRMIIANLSAKLTNAIVCDATNGFKSLAKTDTESVETLAKKITKGDVVTLKAIRELIKRAKNGIGIDGKESTFPIIPSLVTPIIQNQIKNEIMRYTLFLTPDQAEQLKTDTDYKEAVKAVTMGGYSNLYENSLLLNIDGCAIIEFPSWSHLNPGLINSANKINPYYLDKTVRDFDFASYKGTNTETSIGLLVGGGACIYANSGNISIYKEDVDSGRKMIFGGDKILGVKKSVFNAIDSGLGTKYPYHNKDFAVMGLLSSKE